MNLQEECNHKWVPNGITTKEVWVGNGGRTYSRIKWGEKAVASCICEKCGEIKIKTKT